MAQMTLSDLEYSNRKRTTKREQFLQMMDQNRSMGSMGGDHPSVLSQRQTWPSNKRD